MSDTSNESGGAGGAGGDTGGNSGSGESADVWADAVTASVLRIAVGLVGIVLVLFALGRAFGVDLLGAVGEFFATPTGQWIAVAFVGLLLVALAAGGLRSR